jgi:hypothetical protein
LGYEKCVDLENLQGKYDNKGSLWRLKVVKKLTLASDLVCILGIMLDYNSFMLNNVVVKPLK